jgi:hypothetical protein
MCFPALLPPLPVPLAQTSSPISFKNHNFYLPLKPAGKENEGFMMFHFKTGLHEIPKTNY